MVERFEKFKEVKEYFLRKDRCILEEGEVPYRETEFGKWGTSSLINAYEFFTKIQLERFEKFVDLGSGDGRVVMTASLFTEAEGIEGSEALVEESWRAEDVLQTDSSFKKGDYYEEEISGYDAVFMFPDKKFDKEIIQKFKKEFSGVLFVYNRIYVPRDLEKGRTYWVNNTPVNTYLVNTKEDFEKTGEQAGEEKKERDSAESQ